MKKILSVGIFTILSSSVFAFNVEVVDRVHGEPSVIQITKPGTETIEGGFGTFQHVQPNSTLKIVHKKNKNELVILPIALNEKSLNDTDRQGRRNSNNALNHDLSNINKVIIILRRASADWGIDTWNHSGNRALAGCNLKLIDNPHNIIPDNVPSPGWHWYKRGLVWAEVWVELKGRNSGYEANYSHVLWDNPIIKWYKHHHKDGGNASCTQPRPNMGPVG